MKLALAETESQRFLHHSLQLVSSALATTVLFVDEKDAVTHTHTESFLVAAQNKSIGSLLVDKKKLLHTDVDREYIQELADIIGISFLSLRQGEELEALENESEEMLLYAPDIIFVIGAENRFQMANQKAAELFNTPVESLKGADVCAYLGDLSYEELLERSQNGDKFELELIGPQGRRLVSFSVSSVTQENSTPQFLMVGRDITTERQAQLALRRSERATLMAQTIDYVLHEVNNPLGALISSVSTVIRKSNRLQQRLDAAKESLAVGGDDSGLDTEWLHDINAHLSMEERLLGSAKKSGNRIHEAMKMLRAVNLKRTLTDPRPVDIVFELGLAISALEQEHGQIHISQRLENLPLIEAPPLHLAEVFGAVVKNAAEALESVVRDERNILITGQVVENQVIMAVEDNGPGIPGDHRNRAFMPFFTTKPLGSSIGLGLSMAKDMVKRVGGAITLDTSEELGGACVRIVLPFRDCFRRSIPPA